MLAKRVSRIVLFVFSTLICGLAQVSAAFAGSWDGLERVKSSKVERLYARPGVSLREYRRVRVLDCQVSFVSGWEREHRSGRSGVSSADMQRMKSDLSRMFNEIFLEELRKGGGFEITGQDGDDVLVIRPSIVDLDVVAPDPLTAGRSYNFASSAGEMTLVVELFDASSGQLLARGIDREKGRDNGRVQWQSSVTNRAEATRIIRKWSKLAREALDDARAPSTPFDAK